MEGKTRSNIDISKHSIQYVNVRYFDISTFHISISDISTFDIRYRIYRPSIFRSIEFSLRYVEARYFNTWRLSIQYPTLTSIHGDSKSPPPPVAKVPIPHIELRCFDISKLTIR